MAIIRCKMCGGDMEIIQGDTVCECQYCGSKQTIPVIDDEKKAKLYERANKFRLNSEFDKAAAVYESIIDDYEDEAEAYWGNLLCKYGIEYVDDPADGHKVPTCHRSSFDSFMDDPDFERVMDCADAASRSVYREQAKQIEEIRKGIIEVSGKEEPYDIFICYKETAEDGQRTIDSVIAQDVYDALTDKGYRVFFSRISLEDKLGTEYEPYIFAALNSAKVMLAFGTSYDYYQAVWVKNEWSRYLKLMAKDKSKYLIPCYKDIDAYDIPKEFAHLQAQDMGKVGAVQDLLRGVEKLIGGKKEEEREAPVQTVIQQVVGGHSADSQLQRGFIALEDHEWQNAEAFFEEALNIEPKCAEAYLGKLLAKEKKSDFSAWVSMQKGKYSEAHAERLEACPEEKDHIEKMAKELSVAGYLDEDTIKTEYVFDRGYDSVLSLRRKQKVAQLGELSSERLLTRAKQYAAGKTLQQITDGLQAIEKALEDRISQAKREDENSIARVKMAYSGKISSADRKAEELHKEAAAHKETVYQAALALFNKAQTVEEFKEAKKNLFSMSDYKDCRQLGEKCQSAIDRIYEEQMRLKEQKEKQEREEAERKEKRKKTIYMIIMAAVVACFAIAFLVTKVIIPFTSYRSAMALRNEGRYMEAINAFSNLHNYRDSEEQMAKCCILMLQNNTDDLQVGSSFLFGVYEQDNDWDNGKEPIEWIVLARENNRILVTSKYGLDVQPFHKDRSAVSWETCSLREWLNGSFLENAFPGDAQILISTQPSAAEDKVFLLSINEANKLFHSNNDRQCRLTAYAREQVGAGARSQWWLSSIGDNKSLAAYVNTNGVVYIRGMYVDRDLAVRPAMWINLK